MLVNSLVEAEAVGNGASGSGSGTGNVRNWPGDEEWKKQVKGLVLQHLVFQEMRDGWTEKVNMATAAEYGGLVEKQAHLMKVIHIVVFMIGVMNVYSVLNLHCTAHYTYTSVDEIIQIVAQFNTKDGVDIQVRVYMPTASYVDGNFLRVYNSGTPEWSIVSHLYAKLGLKQLMREMVKSDSDPCERGNRQRLFGRASIAFEKRDLDKCHKPRYRKGTNKETARQLAIATKMVDAMYGEGVFFTDEKRTAMFGDETARDFGMEGERIGFESMADMLAFVWDVVYCHFDSMNCAEPGYNIQMGASLPEVVKVNGVNTPARVSKGFYTRSTCGYAAKNMSLGAVVADDWAKEIMKLPAVRREVSREMLKLRPETGYAGVLCHVDKLAGLISLHSDVLRSLLREYHYRTGALLARQLAVEIAYGAIATNKPMQFGRAVDLLVRDGGGVVPAMQQDAFLFEIVCNSFCKIGGNNAGGEYARHQPTFNRDIMRKQAMNSCRVIDKACDQLNEGVEHKKIIDGLCSGVFNADGLGANNLVFIIVMSTIAGLPHQATNATIAGSTNTAKFLKEKYGIETASQRATALTWIQDENKVNTMLGENGICVYVSPDKVDTMKAGQSISHVVDNKIIELSDEHPDGIALPPGHNVTVGDTVKHRTKHRWWDANWRRVNAHEPNFLIKVAPKKVKGSSSKKKRAAPVKGRPTVKKIKLNANDRTHISAPPQKANKKSKKKKKKKKLTEGEKSFSASMAKANLVVDVGRVSRRTRRQAELNYSGHPPVAELQVFDTELLFGVNLWKSAAVAIQMDVHGKVVRSGGISKHDMKLQELGKNSWICTIDYMERKHGGDKLNDFKFPIQQRGIFPIPNDDEPKGKTKKSKAKDEPTVPGGDKLNDAKLPIQQRGTFPIANKKPKGKTKKNKEKDEPTVPGYRSKISAKRAALFHVLCFANDGKWLHQFVPSLRECKPVALYLDLKHNDAKPWAIIYAFQGEAFLVNGHGTEGSPRLKLPLSLE